VPALSHRPHPGRRPGDLVGPVSPGSRRPAPVAERCKCRSWETTIRQTVHGTGQTSWRRWRRSGEERAGAGAATPVGCGARCRQRAVRASASPRRPASWWFRFWGVAADSDSSGSAAGQLLRRRGGGRADRGDVRAVDAGPVHGELPERGRGRGAAGAGAVAGRGGPCRGDGGRVLPAQLVGRRVPGFTAPAWRWSRSRRWGQAASPRRSPPRQNPSSPAPYRHEPSGRTCGRPRRRGPEVDRRRGRHPSPFGADWTAIGRALGVSHQAAGQRAA
jgi:hypothetical protein